MDNYSYWSRICVLVMTGILARNYCEAGNDMNSKMTGHAEGDNICRVEKDGDNVFIRCVFSIDKDLQHHVGKGINKQIAFKSTILVTADTNGIVQATGDVIHGISDDCTPWSINGTFIGANHGCSDVRELTCPGHGKTESDLGSEWQDGAGTKFYIIKIVDDNRVWVLSENKGSNDIWKFVTTIAGSALTNTSAPDVFKFSSNIMAQLTPACRIRKQEYLSDGKTALPEKKAVACNYLDIVEEYDIINPASLLAKIRQSPGKAHSFVGAGLEGVIHNSIIYRFLPNGAIVIYHTSTALQDFKITGMGFIQSAKMNTGHYQAHEYYIPKTKPFCLGGINYNFLALQDFKPPVPIPVVFQASAGTLADEQALPDRFIQLLGDRASGKFSGQVGFALGYSPISGVTKSGERSRNTNCGGSIYKTSKSYPCAIDAKIGAIVRAGTVFNCVAYRVYFDPQRYPKATCVYWYKENNDYLVYLDYHQNVDNEVVVLPPAMTGKRISIVEKTPSLTLTAGKMVPEKGIILSVTDNYGYAVLRISEDALRNNE